jgi:DNA polymerase-4/DNA polymerase IV (DinB-like DNA polymerase)
MDKTIIHVDMDAFFAAVEVRDDPSLRGKPLIIGALPHERGVVATCSYEAREYGVRSAMSIKEAYRLCPQGIYMHPNGEKYKAASDQIQKIWLEYTDIVEFISLDEGFLDVTGSAAFFGGAKKIGLAIKERTKSETGLTCSVGIGYSMMSAKLASEEKKPDGYFEILSPEALRDLIIDRNVRIIYGVGPQTAAELQSIGISTVRGIYENTQAVVNLLGNHGRQIIALANGIDNRAIETYTAAQSIGKERTFQQDITDTDYLKDVLRLIAKDISYQLRLKKTYCRTVTLKVTFKDMKKITRSKSGDPINRADDIYRVAASLLDKVDKRPIRLVGISLSGFTDDTMKQLSLLDPDLDGKGEKLDAVKMDLQRKYGRDIVMSGGELIAVKRFHSSGKEES